MIPVMEAVPAGKTMLGTAVPLEAAGALAGLVPGLPV